MGLALGVELRGLTAGRGRLSAPRAESPLSCQMRLLLVKRGSSLPLYLRLATDHLRLFTLYEQVGWGRKPSPLIFSVLIHFPFFIQLLSPPSLYFSYPHPVPPCDHHSPCSAHPYPLLPDLFSSFLHPFPRFLLLPTPLPTMKAASSPPRPLTEAQSPSSPRCLRHSGPCLPLSPCCCSTSWAPWSKSMAPMSFPKPWPPLKPHVVVSGWGGMGD